MKNFNKHFLYYVVSLTIFALGLTLIFLSNYSQKVQFLYVVMVAIMYMLWSLLHHYVHHNLHVKLVIEYALIAILGVVLSFYIFSAA